MDWQKLYYFLKVAEAGAFLKAAKDLGVSQPFLCTQVANFEREIGLKLYTRHYRGIHLTPEGQELYDSGKRIEQQIQHAENALHKISQPEIQTLSIVSTPGFSQFLSIHILPEFLRTYPSIHLSFVGSDQKVSLGGPGADLMIGPYIHGQTGLIQEELLRLSMRIFGSQDYINQHGRPKDFKELDEHKIIAYSQESGLGDVNALLFKGNQNRRPYIEINSLAAITRLASQGFGLVAINETPLKKTEEEAGLIDIFPDEPSQIIPIYLIYERSLKAQHTLIKFKDFLLEKFKEVT